MKEQWHDAAGWRSLGAATVFLTVAAVVCIALDLRVLAGIFVVGAALGGFVTGYCYRQRVLNLGRKPSLPFLVLKDDPLLGDDGRA